MNPIAIVLIKQKLQKIQCEREQSVREIHQASKLVVRLEEHFMAAVLAHNNLTNAYRVRLPELHYEQYHLEFQLEAERAKGTDPILPDTVPAPALTPVADLPPELVLESSSTTRAQKRDAVGELMLEIIDKHKETIDVKSAEPAPVEVKMCAPVELDGAESAVVVLHRPSRVPLELTQLALPAPEVAPAPTPDVLLAQAASSMFSVGDTYRINTQVDFILYCQAHPRLVELFTVRALAVAYNTSARGISISRFYKEHMMEDVGYSVPDYVKACLAHAFHAQYPEHRLLFVHMRHMSFVGLKAGRSMARLWAQVPMPIYS